MLGISFKLVTDCQAFTMTMRKKDLRVRVARWALLLEEFDYTIEHRPGKSMTHVDALSRNPPNVAIVEENNDGLIARLTNAQHEDEGLKWIFNTLECKPSDDFFEKNEILFKKINGELLLVVPKAMQHEVIRKAHERGHFAVRKTEQLIRREFWFDKMREKIGKVIRNCVTCLLAERIQGKREGLLNPIDKGDTPLQTDHVDHLRPLSSTRKNYKHIFVVINSFTKYVWLYPTKSTTTGEVVSRLKKQATIFGNPQRLISDKRISFHIKRFSTILRE